MARIANGVSQLHGVVSRAMWNKYPGICEITSITNAQEFKYWADKPLYNAKDENDETVFDYRKKHLKKKLFKIVADQTGNLFNPNVFTIVWARRFAGYKRADLLLHDKERFYKLLNHPKYPVQIIWAGNLILWIILRFLLSIHWWRKVRIIKTWLFLQVMNFIK
jgi:starch phosphorylase